jgi:hypothetical protein
MMGLQVVMLLTHITSGVDIIGVSVYKPVPAAA